MRPLRVLHVAQPTTAGVPRVVAQLVADQVARGWDVAVAGPDGGHLRPGVEAAGARWLPWEATRAPGPVVAGETRRLARIVREQDPALVHLHSAKAGLAGRLALRGQRPTVFQPHAWSFLAVSGPVRRASVAWERWAARWASAVVVVSDDERVEGEAAGVRARWELVPNGVDVAGRPAPADGQRAAARAALGVGPGPLAVCVGRLCRQKGQDRLVEAWPAVARARPDAVLVLVGDGPDLDAVRGSAPPGVVLAGAVDDADPWLLAADVVALPSRWEAGLSLVAMEAMRAARPVVIGRVAGAASLARARAGEVVDVDAPDGVARLAAALLRRLDDPALVRAEGAAGRRLVEAEHDVRRTTARVAALYPSLLRR